MQATSAPLAPAYPHWPEKREPVATVICEGPSAHWDQENLIRHVRGPVVAVNRAVAYSEHVPIDFWATVDTPRNLWAWSQDYRHDDLRFLTVRSAILEWWDIVDDITRVYQWHPSHMIDEGLKDAEGGYPLVPTIFHTLAWLLHVGVKEVRLLGCDMYGHGTPFDDWRAEETDGYDVRWVIEREMLAHSMRHYRAKGARIKRWQKSK